MATLESGDSEYVGRLFDGFCPRPEHDRRLDDSTFCPLCGVAWSLESTTLRATLRGYDRQRDTELESFIDWDRRQLARDQRWDATVTQELVRLRGMHLRGQLEQRVGGAPVTMTRTPRG